MKSNFFKCQVRCLMFAWQVIFLQFCAEKLMNESIEAFIANEISDITVLHLVFNTTVILFKLLVVV